MANLYSSLDTLLGMARPFNPRSLQDIPLPSNSDNDDDLAPVRFAHRSLARLTQIKHAQAPSRNKQKAPPPPSTIRISILDLPALKAAAVHFQNGDITRKLEEEVRALEKEVSFGVGVEFVKVFCCGS